MLKSILSLLSFIIGLSCMGQISNGIMGQGPDSGRYHVNQKVTTVANIGNTDHSINYSSTGRNTTTGSSKHAPLDSNKRAIVTFEPYPNPSNGEFNIRFTVLTPGSLQLIIRNSLGVIIHQESITLTGNTLRQFDFRSFEKGIYFISIVNSQGSSTKRMVVK